MNERISRKTADRAKSEIMMRVSAADVGAKYWNAYDDLRTAAAEGGRTEGWMRTMSVYRVYLAGVHDGLAAVTKPEYVSGDFPDDEELMEDEQ